MTKKTRRSNNSDQESDAHQPDGEIATNKADNTSVLEQTLQPLLADLLYPSESDEPIVYVTCYLKQDSPLTGSQIEEWLMLPPSVFTEEIQEADFWKPVTTDEEWHGEEERKRTEAFRQLQQTIEQHLTGRQVFRVGDSEIDVYLLGRTSEGDRAGLKTKVVET